MPIFRGAGGAGDATNDATVTAVQAAATSAATSATNAANSATAAATSASGAATSATNASNSAATAAGSVATAAGHASSASTFATNASLSATDAEDAATEAEGYASEAFDYKVEASVSAASAASSASSATASQLAAETAALAVDDVLTDPDFITVLGLSDELQTVANNSANITAVANNSTNINAVAANETNIDLVAANVSDIGVVAELEADIDTVAGISSNVTTVAGISSNVTTVAGISGNVTTVATNNANVTTVATNIASVNTNATNIANINQNAANIVAIQNASANATAAASSATAAAGSATSASASAAAASAVALGNEPVRHSVRPSLLLDFANTKTLDPRITFTRASTGTFYDGKTVAKAEENLILQSQAFTTSPWAVSAAGFTLNNVTAPDGTTTGSTLTIASASANAGAFQSTGITTAGVTLSIFAKAGTCNFVGIAPSSTAVSCYANFNLSTGAVASSAGCTASITNVGNGWYRCVLANSTLTSNGFAVFAPKTSDPAGHPWAAGTPTIGDSVLLWGAQLEVRSSVTAYTVTTTAPITNYIPALQSAASGVARFEHNPTTGESLGLAIEEQRTNLQVRSQEFDNAVWTSNFLNILAFGSGSTANIAISPDGTQTADLVVESTASSAQHFLFGTVFSDATTKTFSVYVKSAGRTRMRLQIGASSANQGVYADVNLTAGTISNATLISGSYTAVGSSITNVGNGWYRCSVTVTTPATAHTGYILIADASGATNYTGDGYSGIYIWGAQIEAGAFATSYIPTVASQVTRSADAASMTGTNFSSWYRADEGTVYAESFIPTNADSVSGNYYLAICDGTFSNSIMLADTGTTTTIVWSGGSVQFNQGVGGEPTTFAKMSLAYKTNDFISCVNATLSSAVTSGRVPVVDRLLIGIRGDSSASTINNGTIKKIAYYAKKLTNSELQGLTTV